MGKLKVERSEHTPPPSHQNEPPPPAEDKELTQAYGYC
jgi:hypothetical protein